MLEKTKEVDGVKITYVEKNKKFDNNHLIVILSGFGGTGEFTYDFMNSLSTCPAHIVWIKDDFAGHASYYSCVGLNFSTAFIVNKFIEQKLAELNISKENCTLAGFSKGGSAALLLGTKFNYKNIVSTVPQFNIGTYVEGGWKKVAEHMLGEINELNIKKLDCYLPDTIDADKDLDKNIYLLTSPSDEQYKTEIEPNLSKLIKYKNFNLLVSKSLLVRAHNQVTSHNASLLISILTSISMEATPRYGYVEIHGDQNKDATKVDRRPFARLKKINISEGLVFPEGIAVITGVNIENWPDIYNFLVLRNKESEFEVPIGKSHKPSLTRDLYSNAFVNYDKGWFATAQYKGLDLRHIPPGKYDCFMKIVTKSQTEVTRILCDKNIFHSEVLDSVEQYFGYSPEGVVFEIKNN